MAVVTKLEKTNKNKGNMYKLFVDEEEIALVHIEAIVKNGMFVGKEVDLNTLKELIFESNKVIAFDQALKNLSKSMKTEKDICTNLKQKGFEAEVVDSVISKLKEYGYINDYNFAKYYVNGSKTKGQHRLKAELKLKGVDDEIIQNLLDDIDEEETIENIEKLASKYMKSKEVDQKNLQKLYQYLARRGFDSEDIMRVINRMREEE